MAGPRNAALVRANYMAKIQTFVLIVTAHLTLVIQGCSMRTLSRTRAVWSMSPKLFGPLTQVLGVAPILDLMVSAADS